MSFLLYPYQTTRCKSQEGNPIPIYLGINIFYSITALQPFVELYPIFRFLILYTFGTTPWTGDQLISRPLSTRRTTRTRNKHTQTSMPRVRFEPMIPASERGRDSSCLRPRGHFLHILHFK
jgi:hypothetical protein